MRSNDDLIGQCLCNDEHVFFNGGGERRGTNGWFLTLPAAMLTDKCVYMVRLKQHDISQRGKSSEAKMSKFRSLFELDEASSSKVNSITTLCFLSGL